MNLDFTLAVRFLFDESRISRLDFVLVYIESPSVESNLISSLDTPEIYLFLTLSLSRLGSTTLGRLSLDLLVSSPRLDLLGCFDSVMTEARGSACRLNKVCFRIGDPGITVSFLENLGFRSWVIILFDKLAKFLETIFSSSSLLIRLNSAASFCTKLP